MATRFVLTAMMLVLGLSLIGCNEAAKTDGSACGCEAKRPLILSITHGSTEPHEVTMALQLAGHALDQGRAVTLFFNVRGVTIASRKLDPSLTHHAEPIGQLLADCMSRGALVLVCPHCMKAMGVEETDLIDGAQVATAQSLFARVDAGAAVFTY